MRSAMAGADGRPSAKATAPSVATFPSVNQPSWEWVTTGKSKAAA